MITVAFGCAGHANLGTIAKTTELNLEQVAQFLSKAQAEQQSFTFEQLSTASGAERKVLKDARWYTFGVYSDTHRRRAHLTAVSALVFDCDQPGTTRVALTAALETLECAYVMATSTSHGLGGRERWRVIVPLRLAITPAEHASAWEFIADRLAPMVDMGAKDATRLNYFPKVPQGAIGHDVIACIDRKHFDASVLTLIGAPSAKGDCAAASRTTEQRRGGWAIEEIEEWINKHCDPSAPEATWWRVIRAIHFETDGSQEGLALACRWSRLGSNYTGDHAITSRWHSPSWDNPSTPATTLTTLRKEVLPGLDDFPVEDAPEGKPLAASPLGEVPQAHSLCSDQRNAIRIRDDSKGQLFALANVFYSWTGTHWRRDEAAATRRGARLSAIVRHEANAAREKLKKLITKLPPEIAGKYSELQQCARPERTKLRKDIEAAADGADILELGTSIEALDAWVKSCDMEPTQTRALRLLRRMLTLESAHLDREKHLLNCLNGTVDLRTGKLKRHETRDFITQLAPTSYDPGARAPRFEQFLLEIMDGDVALVEFLQRWLGYCLSGETREQAFALHVGGGSNGKTRLFDAIEDVIGSSSLDGYCHTVPSTLLASEKSAERHPTEVADLLGKRFGMASETEEGAHLRESLLKGISGEDEISGRFMYGNFFTFKPVIKLNLRTNKKPIVRNQEFATWRRILLVNYGVTFGSEADVAAGKASRMRDNRLGDKLLAERDGILNWLVRGAVAWYETGLLPPESILAARREYQTEQDRVAEFVRTCCDLDKQAWVAITGPFGIYPVYTSWCRENGYQPRGKGGFIDDMQRIVSGFKPQEARRKVGDRWKTITGAFGVRVNLGDDGGFPLNHLASTPKAGAANVTSFAVAAAARGARAGKNEDLR